MYRRKRHHHYPSVATPVITTSLTLTANQQTGLALNLDMSKAITVNLATQIPTVDLTATNVLTAVPLPRRRASPPGKLDFVETSPVRSPASRRDRYRGHSDPRFLHGDWQHCHGFLARVHRRRPFVRTSGSGRQHRHRPQRGRHPLDAGVRPDRYLHTAHDWTRV